ncbi:hypothetical protein ISCGN_019691 [Ixodes scapularis]
MKNLETCCEIPVFMAALVWLNVDYANRSAHAAEVMSCVRFTHMTSEELVHCFFPPLRPEVIEIPAVRKHLTAGCIYLVARLEECCYLFPEYETKPREYKGRHLCHLWRLPNALEAEADLLLHLNIQRETYLQRRVLGPAAADTEQFKVTRLYAIAKGLVQRHRFLVLHYHDPDPREPATKACLRKFGMRRYSVQKKLNWTQSPWRQCAFNDKFTMDGDEPIIALLGGLQSGLPQMVATGLTMVRMYPQKAPFFKRFGILPRPLFHLSAIVFKRTVFVVGGLDLRQAYLKLKRPSKCCFAYNLSTLQWRRIANLKLGRVFHMLVAHEGIIYAIGGQGNDDA